MASSTISSEFSYEIKFGAGPLILVFSGKIGIPHAVFAAVSL